MKKDESIRAQFMNVFKGPNCAAASTRNSRHTMNRMKISNLPRNILEDVTECHLNQIPHRFASDKNLFLKSSCSGVFCHVFLQAGTDVMILKIFSPKSFAEKIGVFFTQTTASFCKNLIRTLVFEKNANFFAKNCQKSREIVIITSTLD
jgi:hypothetical protein